MKAETATPVSILIAALGGEGGGVLSNWLVESAIAAGFPVQSTSIPGVAQRTGATTYYLEIFPVPTNELGDREPVLTLTPGPGEIDLMIASELLEAGRAMQNGFISPDRTTLIASTTVSDDVIHLLMSSGVRTGHYFAPRGRRGPPLDATVASSRGM